MVCLGLRSKRTVPRLAGEDQVWDAVMKPVVMETEPLKPFYLTPIEGRNMKETGERMVQRLTSTVLLIFYCIFPVKWLSLKTNFMAEEV